ncbi:MAG: PEP-CTERM sorting domain-containing protein [Burkholderiales bacterium]|nr:PEP-CTERM sorting domain-containing protein [Burkholderiales bacterium]
MKGFASAGGASYGGNIGVTAVPEPETYAMLLAGLGLMGAIARRRNNKAA